MGPIGKRSSSSKSKLVRRDQFNITPQGIVHKPTDAAFTPHPGDPFSGIERSGQLYNAGPDGGFDAERGPQINARAFG
jgi:hypothetical protein